jgi:hypothetical protein
MKSSRPALSSRQLTAKRFWLSMKNLSIRALNEAENRGFFG